MTPRIRLFTINPYSGERVAVDYNGPVATRSYWIRGAAITVVLLNVFLLGHAMGRRSANAFCLAQITSFAHSVDSVLNISARRGGR